MRAINTSHVAPSSSRLSACLWTRPCETSHSCAPPAPPLGKAPRTCDCTHVTSRMPCHAQACAIGHVLCEASRSCAIPARRMPDTAPPVTDAVAPPPTNGAHRKGRSGSRVSEPVSSQYESYRQTTKSPDADTAAPCGCLEHVGRGKSACNQPMQTEFPKVKARVVPACILVCDCA